MAPYRPAGYDKESAFFKAADRESVNKIKDMHRKGFVDVNYEPRMTSVRKKPVCLVRIDPKSTVKKLTK